MNKIKKGDIFVYNDNILVCKGVYKCKTDNIGHIIKQPKLEDMKVKIWDKELCNGTEWNDFLKAVEEKDQENKELKEQLAEKDKEIKELKTQFDLYRSMSIQKDWNDPELIKSIRHQVCDEIREKLKKQIIPTAGSWLSYYDIIETNNLLDQIEKGEKQ